MPAGKSCWNQQLSGSYYQWDNVWIRIPKGFIPVAPGTSAVISKGVPVFTHWCKILWLFKDFSYTPEVVKAESKMELDMVFEFFFPVPLLCFHLKIPSAVPQW